MRLFPFRGVIFDMDGLMFDTEPIYRSALLQAAQELGYYGLTEEFHNSFIGRSMPKWQGTLMQTFGDDYPKFRSRRRQLWEQHIRELGAAQKAGLGELLDELDKIGVAKAIATSSSQPDALLCLGELANRFDAIVTGDEVEHGKPAPDIYLLAAQRLTLAPYDLLVLEDSESGAKAALAAEMTVIVVPDLQQPSPELAAQALRVCASLHEVKKEIELMGVAKLLP